ncbi:MAG: DUF308 domain-containing protein [Oscillospiraceae bacterium]|nr:DUF308 domain-containing protein [Oscillospiraceae bacterium]
MLRIGSMSKKEKKELAGLALWLIAGMAMIIMGISAVLNRDKAISAVSNVLGICALITGLITLAVRIAAARLKGISGFDLDWLIWLVVAFLLFNTSLLLKLGKLAFVIGGIAMLLEGVRSFFSAMKARSENEWYIPRIVFSIIFIVLGIGIIINAQVIFESMIVLAIGIYFIVHGTEILYDWLGRARYFRNFRGLEV